MTIFKKNSASRPALGRKISPRYVGPEQSQKVRDRNIVFRTDSTMRIWTAYDLVFPEDLA